MTRPSVPRTNSGGRLVVKTSRPSPVKLGKQTHKTSPMSKKIPPSEVIQDRVGGDEDMTALPNFCATCEKQINHPNASILYCSAACRKKDGSRPVSECLEAAFPSPSIPHTNEPSYFSDIVPQRSPTMLRPASVASMDDAHTERPSFNRRDSEAASSLSHFLSGASPFHREPGTSYYRNKNSSSHATLPSLSHTPTSLASASSSFTSARRVAPSRALPTRHRHSSTRSFDLIMPVTAPPSPNKGEGQNSLRSHASTAVVFRVAEGELTYEKKDLVRLASSDNGSLKQLFAHDAMRRPSAPTHGHSSWSVSKHVPEE